MNVLQPLQSMAQEPLSTEVIDLVATGTPYAQIAAALISAYQDLSVDDAPSARAALATIEDWTAVQRGFALVFPAIDIYDLEPPEQVAERVLDLFDQAENPIDLVHGLIICIARDAEHSGYAQRTLEY